MAMRPCSWVLNAAPWARSPSPSRVISRSTGPRAASGAPGSIGASAYPSRVVKGKKLPGQMGNARVTTKNLEVVDVRPEENLLLIKGAIPGPRQGLVLIQKTY